MLRWRLSWLGADLLCCVQVVVCVFPQRISKFSSRTKSLQENGRILFWEQLNNIWTVSMNILLYQCPINIHKRATANGLRLRFGWGSSWLSLASRRCAAESGDWVGSQLHDATMADTFGPVYCGRGKTYCYHLLPYFWDEHPFTCVDVWGSIDPWLYFRIHSMKQPRNLGSTKVDTRGYQGRTCPVCVSEHLAGQASAIKNLAMIDCQTLTIPAEPSVRPTWHTVTFTTILTSLSSTSTQGTNNITT